MKIQEIETYVKAGKLDEKLIELYGQEDLAHQKERYLSILQEAEKAFGNEEAKLFSAPGRTEVGGNHTDHQLGAVLAASLNLDCVAVVIPTEDNVVTYKAKDFSVKPVDLLDVAVHAEEKNSTEALIRGVAAGMKARGYAYGGFKAYAESNVIPGGGMALESGQGKC